MFVNVNQAIFFRTYIYCGITLYNLIALLYISRIWGRVLHIQSFESFSFEIWFLHDAVIGTKCLGHPLQRACARAWNLAYKRALKK